MRSPNVEASIDPRASWVPIADRRENDVLSAVHAIANDVHREVAQIDRLPVSHGLAGIALFLAQYQSIALDRDKNFQLMRRILSTIREEFSEKPIAPWLFAGFSGIALALDLIARLPDFGDENPGANEDIDAAIIEILSVDQWMHSYDLVVGLVGLGVYGLHRQDHIARRTITKLVEAHLIKMVERGADGFFWRSIAPQGADEVIKRTTNGTRNLGLAHGIPGVICFFAALVKRKTHDPSLPRLLKRSVDWLLEQELSSGRGAFPATAEETVPTRYAWCYGAPGISASVLSAGEAINDPGVSAKALSLAAYASCIELSKSGVVEPTICHGSSGLMHIFNRLYQRSQDPEMLAAASRWLEITLNYARPGRGIGGFQFVDPITGKGKDDCGLLTGSSGVGLALLATLETLPPTWDRFFLVDM